MIALVRRLAISRNVWIAASLFLAFWAAAAVLDFYTLNTVVRSILLAMSLAVLVAFGRDGLHALAKWPLQRGDQLLLGINASWLGTALQSAFVVLWRLIYPGRPITSHWTTFFAIVILGGAVLHITAPDSLEGHIPRRSLILLGIATGVGLTLAWIFLGVQLGPYG